MIKLQDFAKERGVTDRAIQKHLKTYATELEGLFERKGPNGTWLSEEACEILRSKMKTPPPPVLFEEDPRVKELQDKVEELEQKLREKDMLLTASQNATQKAQDKVSELQNQLSDMKLLEADNKALEGENKRLKGASLGERIFGWNKYKNKASE